MTPLNLCHSNPRPSLSRNYEINTTHIYNPRHHSHQLPCPYYCPPPPGNISRSIWAESKLSVGLGIVPCIERSCCNFSIASVFILLKSRGFSNKHLRSSLTFSSNSSALVRDTTVVIRSTVTPNAYISPTHMPSVTRRCRSPW